MEKLNIFTGGHPFQVDDLVTMQAGTIDALNGICAGLGNPFSAYILTGCVHTGLVMSAGYIFFQGEVFPVDSQAFPFLTIGQSMYWVVQEVVIAPSPVTYQNLSVQNVHVRRRLILQGAFVAPANSVLISVVPRLNQILGLTPQRGVIMYSGSLTNFTTQGLGKAGTQLDGWALCNGNTFAIPGGFSTLVSPNLKGQFIVGYDPLDPDYNAIGNTGGSKTVVLTNAQLPPHTHLLSIDIKATLTTDGGGTPREVLSINNDAAVTVIPGNYGLANAPSNHPSEDGSVDGLVSAPVTIRPPYYTLAYIIKLI
jgi:microcystin-dependent protein